MWRPDSVGRMGNAGGAEASSEAWGGRGGRRCPIVRRLHTFRACLGRAGRRRRKAATSAVIFTETWPISVHLCSEIRLPRISNPWRRRRPQARASLRDRSAGGRPCESIRRNGHPSTREGPRDGSFGWPNANCDRKTVAESPKRGRVALAITARPGHITRERRAFRLRRPETWPRG